MASEFRKVCLGEGTRVMKMNTSDDRTLSFLEELSSLSPTLPWDRFSQWIHAICIVTFDLEVGQAMEMIYPGHIKLNEREKSNICYLSFPDSNSGCMGDTQFHFRIRHCPMRRNTDILYSRYDQECPIALQTDSNYCFGYVYFRQVKDKSQRRGYFQKSVVILSKLPLVNLFYKVVSLIAPEFFENGEPSIEAGCHDVDQWPAPQPGEPLNLPLMGTVLQVRIPSQSDALGTSQSTPLPQPQASSMAIPQLLPTLHEPDIFRYLWPVLSHVHLLWELVLIGEPLVIMASSPTSCSQTVQALVSTIWPIRYCSDYRPFFTIHDSEFKEYTTKTQSPPPVVLGVTNPFFAKTLQHWPHIIRLGDASSNSASPVSQKQKIKKGGSLKTLDCKPGVYTRYHSYLQKDKSILKKLLKGVQNKRPREVQNAILRRHLLELTQSFMIPLERYMASLGFFHVRNISPHKAAPIPKPFNPDDFFKMLETSGPQLTTGVKGDWVGLYKRFFRSPNFNGWYESRHREVSHKLQALHLEALSGADLIHWVQDKKEVEVVDLILKIRGKLETAAEENLPVQSVIVHRLQGHVDDIIGTLPEDLQTVLKTS